MKIIRTRCSSRRAWLRQAVEPRQHQGVGSRQHDRMVEPIALLTRKPYAVERPPAGPTSPRPASSALAPGLMPARSSASPAVPSGSRIERPSMSASFLTPCGSQGALRDGAPPLAASEACWTYGLGDRQKRRTTILMWRRRCLQIPILRLRKSLSASGGHPRRSITICPPRER